MAPPLTGTLLRPPAGRPVTVGPVRWTVHGERPIYDSDWMRLVLVDVEIPGARRFDHHVVRYPKQAAGTVVHDPDRGVLLLWRHRFITDTWGWEVPAGAIEHGETPEQAAARELREETGYEAEQLDLIGDFFPSNGISNQRAFVFAGRALRKVGEVEDTNEVQRMAWFTQAEVRQLIANNKVQDGISLTALLWFLFEQSNR